MRLRLPFRRSDNAADPNDTLLWRRAPSDIQRYYNFNPISIEEALETDLIMACQNVFAKSATEPEFRLQRNDGEELLVDERLEAIINQPNPESDFTELMADTLSGLALMGACYLVKTGAEIAPGINGATTSIWYVSREDMYVERNEALIPVSYTVTNSEVPIPVNAGTSFPPEQVIPLRLLRRDRVHYDNHHAVYPLYTLLPVLTLDSQSTARAATLMRLGAGLAVAPKETERTRAMSSALRDREAQMMNERISELPRRAADGEGVALPEPVDILKVGFPPSEYLSGSVTSRAESRVAAVLGIPEALIGLEHGAEGGQSYASLEILKRWYAEKTQLPLLKIICRKLTTGLVQEYHPDGELVVDEDSIPAIAEARASRNDVLLAAYRSGIYSSHEYTEYANLPLPRGPDEYIWENGGEVGGGGLL